MTRLTSDNTSVKRTGAGQRGNMLFPMPAELRFTEMRRGARRIQLPAREREPATPKMCIYCGVAPGTTNDDVPSKSLFLRPLPANIVKVPACQPCNAGFSMDDE